MPNFFRTPAHLVGRPTAPVAVPPSASVTGTTAPFSFDVDRSMVVVGVTLGAEPPTTPPVVVFAHTPDGSTYVPDGPPQRVPIDEAGATYFLTYRVPPAAVGARATLTNGAGHPVAAWIMSSTRRVVGA